MHRNGQAIGPVLRIDAHTACGIRGRFARLCVQVNLDKPLAKSLTIGKRNQAILYEGINSLCFSCGRIGHRKEGYPYTIKEVHIETPPCQEESPIPQREINEANSKVDNISNDYGEWMVVARRKPTNRYKASIQTQSVSQESETSQGHIGKKTFKGEEVSKKDGKRKVPSQASSGLQRTADKTAKPFPRKDGVMSDSLKVKVRGKSVKQRHWVQSQRNEVGPSFVGPNFSFGVSQSDECAVGPSPTPLIFSSPASSPSKGFLLKPKTRSVTQGVHNNGGHEHVGDFLPRQSHPDWGGDDQMDQTGSDGDLGLVRLGAINSLEESVPAHRDKQEAGLPAHEGRSLGPHTKSMVEVPLRPTSGPNPSAEQLGSICSKIKNAPFGKLVLRSRKTGDSVGDNDEQKIGRASCRERV